MTTKEQELKALAQIRKIVEGLGEDSYVGTAFEGCFEVAEENIKNDFACSMKQEVEMKQRQIENLSSRLEASRNEQEALKRKLQAAEASLKIAKENYKTENAALMSQIEDMEKAAIKEETLDAIKYIFGNEIINLKGEIFRLADTMATLAGTPTDIAFTGAVERYKKVKADIEERQRILKEIER